MPVAVRASRKGPMDVPAVKLIAPAHALVAQKCQ